MDRLSRFAEMFSTMPLIAILRGVKPEEVTEIAGVIIDAGIRIVEIPLNSPEAFDSIEKVTKRLPREAMFGAGTVLTADDVRRVSDAGGEIVVSPGFNGDVVRQSKRLGLVSVPGVMTPSEAFSAIDAGADVLKFFPGELLALPAIRAYAAVLPKHIPVVLVGGVTVESVQTFTNSPVSGFGIGSSLYKPGMTAPEVGRRAKAFVDAMRSAGFGHA